ncbi:beta-N-acetylhexosaminidase [Aureibaculum marinum]|uniref:beta-N-acetylhexosaminidase n=1 Tax=Aureibaculum marinum TaxID=2487930 RepID=A0A3N4NNX0_9FLAO|nr:beta-N-acetylhexosaminidase [Aureibaculum marinum]RPD97994.1 beta-N-acetylhexosaminidase [Aureibaculum marinum]
MKFKVILLFVALFSSSFLFANDSISKYLLFSPRKINIKSKDISIHQSQVKKFKDFLELSIDQSSAGKWKLNTTTGNIYIDFGIDASFTENDQYKLELSKSEIKLSAKNLNGLRYGKQTLLYLLEYVKSENKPLQEIEIDDWATFERRGYMLDVSRDKVPTMASLFMLIDQLSDWRINELQLYTEHTFAYRNHRVVWENASPLTAEEIQQLNVYCLKKGIDLVPNQNSFGHMENWLKHDEYLDLCECETDCNTIWGKRKRTSLAPTYPKSFELMQELYAELLPNFTSKYANIGGDETVELGLGKSKSLSEKIGKGKVYLDFLKKLNDEIIKNGKQTMFWGDIVLNHSELIKDIPKNMIALVWGYDASYPFDKNLAKFHQANLDFYVCPGTSTWRSEIGRNHNAFQNLKNAAIQGEKYEAKGYLITDWGDYGHFQPKSVSYPTLVLGSNYAWNYSDKTLDNLSFLMNKYVFQDNTGNTAKALLTLGNAYLKADIPAGNANAFHLMLRRYEWTIKGHYQTKHLNKTGLLAAEKEIMFGLELLNKAKPTAADAEIIVKEVEQAANLALFGIHLGLERLKAKGMETKNISKKRKQKLALELENLIKNHKEIWTVRNREGGLNDSVSKLEDLLNYLKK